MDSRKRTLTLGFSLIAVLALTCFWPAISRWLAIGFNVQTDLSFIGYVALISMTLGTSVHLWSRLPTFSKESTIRTLFLLMGTSFIIISVIFLYYIIDTLLTWEGLPSLSNMVDSTLPDGIKFSLFGIFNVSMPLSSILMFAFIMLGVSFFIFPLERYVKSRRPWFAISLWICLCVLPLLAMFKDNAVVLSISTAGIVLFVLINFIFMFYLYISLARMSAGKMRTASVLVAIGLFSMIFVWVMGIGILDDKILQSIIQFIIGVMSVSMFNTGFYIMRS
nr:hypothetical protein [Candidatus Sigynarchaeota archaeon]